MCAFRDGLQKALENGLRSGFREGGGQLWSHLHLIGKPTRLLKQVEAYHLTEGEIESKFLVSTRHVSERLSYKNDTILYHLHKALHTTFTE